MFGDEKVEELIKKVNNINNNSNYVKLVIFFIQCVYMVIFHIYCLKLWEETKYMYKCLLSLLTNRRINIFVGKSFL